jgi:catechol 2,3-dioxygenase-like lactoylglutathione lyase family enzyme
MEDEDGKSFVHVELNTTDVDKAKKFYRQLFDWHMEDVAMGPSGQDTVIKPATGTGGGMLTPDARRADVLAGLCRGGGCRGIHAEGQVTGRQDHTGRHEVRVPVG